MNILVKRYNLSKYLIYPWIILIYWNVSCLCASLSTTSTANNQNITQLHLIELELIRAVSQFIDVVKENMIEFEDIADQAKQNVLAQMKYGTRNYLAHPVAAFSVVKRFAEGWGKLKNFIEEEDPTTKLLKIVQKYRRAFPTSQDLYSIPMSSSYKKTKTL